MELTRRLAEAALRSEPVSAARILEKKDTEASAEVIARLDPEAMWAVLRVMVPGTAAAVLARLPEEAATGVLSAMPSQHAAVLLRRISKERSGQLFDALPEGRRRSIKLLFEQREGTAGALADPDVAVLSNSLRVADAVRTHRNELIRATYDVPVVDGDHKLVGMVSLEDLAVAPGAQSIADVMMTEFAAIPSRSSFAAIVDHSGWQSRPTLPVVDGGGVLLGLLRYESLRLMERELSAQRPSQQVSTAQALGDLFAAGVGGMFDALVRDPGGTRGR